MESKSHCVTGLFVINKQLPTRKDSVLRSTSTCGLWDDFRNSRPCDMTVASTQCTSSATTYNIIALITWYFLLKPVNFCAAAKLLVRRSKTQFCFTSTNSVINTRLVFPLVDGSSFVMIVIIAFVQIYGLFLLTWSKQSSPSSPKITHRYINLWSLLQVGRSYRVCLCTHRRYTQFVQLHSCGTSPDGQYRARPHRGKLKRWIEFVQMLFKRAVFFSHWLWVPCRFYSGS